MIYLCGLVVLALLLFTHEGFANTFLLVGFVLGLIVTLLILFN